MNMKYMFRQKALLLGKALFSISLCKRNGINMPHIQILHESIIRFVHRLSSAYVRVCSIVRNNIKLIYSRVTFMLYSFQDTFSPFRYMFPTIHLHRMTHRHMHLICHSCGMNQTYIIPTCPSYCMNHACIIPNLHMYP